VTDRPVSVGGVRIVIAMGFDVFVQGFRHGAAAALPTAAFHAVFRPHIDRIKPEHGYHHVTAPDHGQAHIYAQVNGEYFTGFMVNHFSEGDVLDLLADFAHRAHAVILPVGCPTLLVSPDQREHLPAELLGNDSRITIVTTGHDIRTAIRSA
jgi:hypothetical protein